MQSVKDLWRKNFPVVNRAVISRGKKFSAISKNCRKALAMSAADIDDYDLKISVENFHRRLNLLGTMGTEGTT